jgi:hypothetical protein
MGGTQTVQAPFSAGSPVLGCGTMGKGKTPKQQFLLFCHSGQAKRDPESSKFNKSWMPGQARHDIMKNLKFYNCDKVSRKEGNFFLPLDGGDQVGWFSPLQRSRWRRFLADLRRQMFESRQ